MPYSLNEVDEVRRRRNVSYEEAKEALDNSEGNVLSALLYLENKHKPRVEIRKVTPSTGIGRFFRGVFKFVGITIVTLILLTFIGVSILFSVLPRINFGGVEDKDSITLELSKVNSIVVNNNSRRLLGFDNIHVNRVDGDKINIRTYKSIPWEIDKEQQDLLEDIQTRTEINNDRLEIDLEMNRNHGDYKNWWVKLLSRESVDVDLYIDLPKDFKGEVFNEGMHEIEIN